MKEPNHITGENPITGLHALVESLVLRSLYDCLQDTDVETDSSTEGSGLKRSGLCSGVLSQQ